MTYKIHFELADGSEDSVIVRGNTIAEIQAKAHTELGKRDGINPWSEEVS